MSDKPTDEGVEQSYHPNYLPEKAGLSCFLEQSRTCGPDCMAFSAQTPTDNEGRPLQEYVGEQWAHCHLLVNLHRLGKTPGTIVAQLAKSRGEANLRARQPEPEKPR